MLRRHYPGSYKHMLLSDSETESDDNINRFVVSRLRKRNGKWSMINNGENLKSNKNGKGKKSLSADEADTVVKPSKSKTNVIRDALVELAKEYQNHMKKIPIPKPHLGDAMAVVNWEGLAKTLKNLCGQPLHYLTYMLCKQWDKSRLGCEDEEKPLDIIFNWSKAEATLWHVEEIHRLCTSPNHLAMLWLGDPEYRDVVDEVIPSP